MTLVSERCDLHQLIETADAYNGRRLLSDKIQCNNKPVNRSTANQLDCSGNGCRRASRTPRAACSFINILIIVAILTIVNIKIGSVSCGSPSAIDASDSRKINDEDSILNGVGSPGANAGLYLDKIGSLEMSIAAVFNKVAYGTTTKRSIPDNVFVPSLTTVPTPHLTTIR